MTSSTYLLGGVNYMITLEQLQAAAQAAEADTITFAAQELHKELVLGGPNQVAEFHVFKRGGFAQGITSFNLGGADINRIHDRLSAFTKDVRYSFTQLDPHVRLRLEENHSELTPELVTAVLTAVAFALGGTLLADETPEEPETPETPEGPGTEDPGTEG
ncbi:hypothetical protein LIS04_172 [Listeria phage LIS04]|nr:hypothetical protein LIS04_172 [Listeria phage LIS04]